MDPILVVVLLGALVALVGWPFYRGTTTEQRENVRVADLLAARESKYREIRELELDHRTGKVNDDDFRSLDRQLRAEAIEILHELDKLGAGDATLRAP